MLIGASRSGEAQQLAEWADQRTEEIRLERILPLAGGRWAVIGTTTFAGSHLISVRNPDGTIAWEDVSPFFVDGWNGDVVLLPDSGLLHMGITDGCDYYSPPSRVRRYAADGTILWERMTPLETWSLRNMVAKAPTELIAVASADSMWLMDLNGAMVDSSSHDLGELRRLHWQGDSALFALTYDSLYRIAMDGSVLDSADIGITSSDIRWDGEQVFVLADSAVLRFDQDLQLQNSTPLPTLGWSSTFTTSEDGLFINADNGLHQIADDGSVSLVFSWPALPAHMTTGCAVKDDAVLAVGNTSISGRSTGIIRQLSMVGEAAQHDEDVEVLLQVDSTWTEYLFGNYWKRRANITGFVVNHGSAPLNDVVVSTWTDVIWLLCAIPGHRVVATELGLLPGDTASLPFGTVDVAITYESQTAGIGDICIVALAPNNLADRHPEDNTACVATEFVLGLNDPMRSPQLALSPNPASSSVHITTTGLGGTNIRVRILDAIGRAIQVPDPRASVTGSTVDVSGLPPGAYLVNVAGDRATAVGRLLVARP